MPKGIGYPMDENRKIKARIDLKQIDSVNDVSLGDEITVVVKGKVVELQGPREYMDYDSKGKERPQKWPGELCLEVGKFKIEKLGEFDGMFEDE